ncbi:MAG: hypothetical protein QOG20_1870 [Pseudonocardiales bacterium]|nr:hypothetical protein [Pseudonocardiales bacterium]
MSLDELCPELDELLRNAPPVEEVPHEDEPPPLWPGEVSEPSGSSHWSWTPPPAVRPRCPEAELIDAIAGFEKLISWAGVRQSVLLAEFARRRRAEDREAGISQRLQSTSRWAPDEIGLALSRTRMTAIADWGRRCSCVTCCPQRWRRGRRAGWMR